MLTLMVNEVKLFLLMKWFTVFLSVNGCGVIPSGRAIMAYSEDPTDKTRAPTISGTKSEAESFVRTMVMQTIVDVLYQQGRSALLSDNVISSILQQLYIQISYESLKCERVVIDPTMANNFLPMKINCITTDDTIVNICDLAANDCVFTAMATKYKPIPAEHLSISGNFKTTNAIMANWSNQMWQSVLNRVLRRITSGQYASYFYGASVKLR